MATTYHLGTIGVPSESWREVFAIVGAVLVGGMAWGRMTLFVPPHVEQGVAGRPASFPLVATTKGG